jgi:arabinofuranosyltransferase
MLALGERIRADPRSAILCGTVALLFIAHAVYLACVTEDAYITFHYARNLVSGHGLVWNIGEAPVEGYTNFLWLLICAAVLSLGIDLPSASQWLGVTASLATLIMVFRCALLLGWSNRFATLPCLALACSGPFAAWATSGMETNAFTLWITAAVYYHARFLSNDRPTNAWLCYGSLLLASLTRPEGLLVAVIVVLASIKSGLEFRSSNPARLRALAVAMICYGILISIYLLWRWNYFHYPLPNTFYAKTGGGLAQVLRGVHYSGLFALHFVSPWILALILPLIHRPGTPREKTTDGLLPLCVGVVASYSVYVSLVGGDYMAMYRFFVPVLPLFYLLIAAGIHRVASTQHPTRGLATAVKAAVLLGLMGTLFHSTPLESQWVEKPELMHGNYRGVQSERWFVARHRVMGDFFARYGQPGESIATGAIGVVAYFSGLAVYDVHGITDVHIAHHGYSPADLGSGLPGHEKTDYPYIFAKKPTFYIFSRKLRKEPLAGIPLLVDEVDELVAREYRVGSVRLDDETNGQSGYFSFLERRDRESTER